LLELLRLDRLDALANMLVVDDDQEEPDRDAASRSMSAADIPKWLPEEPPVDAATLPAISRLQDDA
jgi:hypothetical protein